MNIKTESVQHFLKMQSLLSKYISWISKAVFPHMIANMHEGLQNINKMHGTPYHFIDTL
jgi:hypothetical protein